MTELVRRARSGVRALQSVLGRSTPPEVFTQLTAPVATRLRLATALVIASCVLGMGPYLGGWLLARDALGLPDLRATTATPDGIEPAALLTILIGVLGSAVLAAVLRILAYGLSHTADVDLGAAIRGRIARHLATVELGWFTSGADTRVLGTLESDVDELHTAVAHGRLDVAVATCSPLLAVGFLAVVDWRMTLIVLIPVAVSYALMARAMRGSAEQLRGVGPAVAELTGAVAATVRDAPALRVSGRELDRPIRAGADRVRTAMGAFATALELAGARAGALVAPITTLALVLLVGTGLVAAGLLAAVDLLPFLLLATTVAGLLRLPETRAALQGSYAAAGRLQGVLDLPAMPRAAAPRLPVGRDVVLEGVGFAHTPGHPVLHEVDLRLPVGTTTALVGPSGAGKSTLAGLVARFHDPDTGRVRLGGVDLREVAEPELYRRVGFLLQHAALLRASVRDNIRLARPDADDDAVRAAARAAAVHERILALPRGYDTVLGQDTALSGGERQRLAIARVLLADPDVLVLDEPTAHLDPETEAELAQSLRTLAAGRTVLVVAHRLATVVDADQIVVLDGGRVVATGRHDDLVAVPGRYRDLWARTAPASSGAPA